MRKKTKIKARKANNTTASAPVTADIPPTPPAATAVTATRPVGKPTSKGRSTRYTPEQQAEIVQFVHDHNAKNGRAGQASASKKYGVSALTISKWLKASGKPVKKKAPGRPGRPRTASTVASAAPGIEGTLKRMLEIQTKLLVLRAEYVDLREKL